MKKVLETRKDIVFHVVMFPLRIHPEAYVKSKAIICEKSIKLLEDAYDRKLLPEPSCETDIIDKNITLADSLGITSTPALVFQDGRKASGAMKAEALIKLIDNN
jgi:thiol:disulfide interchange protein DsbC